MSAPARDTVFYEGQPYSLILRSPGGLFEPERFGITTKMLSTACERGFLCTYEIIDSRLFLASLEIQATAPGGYPLINDVPPAFDAEAGGDYSPPASYSGICLPLPFTGSFLLAANLDYSFQFSIFMTPDWMWRQLLTLELVDGCVRAVNDRSEEMAKIRASKPKPVFSGRGECLNADELCSMKISKKLFGRSFRFRSYF